MIDFLALGLSVLCVIVTACVVYNNRRNLRRLERLRRLYAARSRMDVDPLDYLEEAGRQWEEGRE